MCTPTVKKGRPSRRALHRLGIPFFLLIALLNSCDHKNRAFGDASTLSGSRSSQRVLDLQANDRSTRDEQVQRPPAWARLAGVTYSRSETSTDYALEKAILATLPGYAAEIQRMACADPEGLATTLVRYFYNRVDLDDDGNLEVIVWLHNSYLVGGTGGYTAQIYRNHGQGRQYTLLWNGEGTWNPIIVSPRKVNGWHSLITFVSGRGNLPGYWVEIDFDGTTYPAWVASGNRLDTQTVRGQAFISDDWWTGFRGIVLLSGPDT
jgi:hypothetical protein